MAALVRGELLFAAVTTQQAFTIGLQHHRAGRLPEAEALYRQILGVQPGHADALHHLGIIALQRGRHDLAVKWIRHAILLRPDNPSAHSNLGEAYRALGEFTAAIEAYRQALQLHPKNAEICYNLGMALRKVDRLEEAIAAFQRALQIKPDYGDAMHDLGVALRIRNRPGDAVASYQIATQLRPGDPEVHNDLGILLARDGRFAEAEEAYRRAIGLDSGHRHAHYNLGIALAAQGRFADAVAAYECALRLTPHNHEAQNNRGIALAGLGWYDDAIAAYHCAIQIKPDYPDAHYNLGIALAQSGQLEQAISAYRRALELKPGYPEVYNNLGNALKDQRQVIDAAASFRHAIASDLEFADAHLNLGLALLLLGQYEEGWREYDWRWRSSAQAHGARNLAAPLWNGDSIAGQTLFIHAEQGFGDTLQFVRYLPLVCAQSGARQVILECRPPLIPLLDQLHSPQIDIVAYGAMENAAQAFDWQIPLLSLPLKLNYYPPLSVSKPYLQADSVRRAHWRAWLGTPATLRIGLTWAGSRTFANDQRRSIPPDKLLPLLDIPDVQFISLRVDPKESLPPTFASAGVLDFREEIGDFSDSAALLAELDLIITVDTAAAHLAGALGRPVWLLLPYVPDWRWGLDGEETPWYPTMRLFRQSAAGDWETVIRRVVEELQRTNLRVGGEGKS